MKNKTGMISGFALDVIGFLLMFELILLDNVSLGDELVPGIVVIASLLNGLVFAFIGSSIQNYCEEERLQVRIVRIFSEWLT